ncbi:MAG TPA: SLBB domain-containing protein [Gemmatimonadaceae bacterium]|jgi:protein involved in polysaccharide export with SLBB domain|nr:SLBB domain-containing protein [Gemmatimonadaceae bacterium]
MPTALLCGMLSSAPHLRPSLFRSLSRYIGFIAITLLIASRPASAQSTEAMQPMATRADLTALAERLERGNETERNQGAALRARLREGDFRPGDRILLIIEGNVLINDTTAVVAGPKIVLTDIGDIPLNGVLRSELQNHMKTQLARYIKDARVRVTPLVSVSVLGPVGRPGFYFMPPDIPLTDAVMRAGGPGSSADLARSVIKRGTDELYDSRNTQTAFTEGLTLDQLSLRSGDQIVVGTQSGRSWQSIASFISVTTSLILALSYGLSRR